MTADQGEAWIDAAIARHTRDFSTSEFLKAVRALSARYVERRGELGRRSPIDSAGKRAAFAAFFAPIHFLTARAAVHALGAHERPIRTLLDLGCGTGAVSAAWASSCPAPPAIVGVDRDGSSLAEAAWTWRQFQLSGRTRRGDFVPFLDGAAEPFLRHPSSLGIVLGWSVNELDGQRRADLLTRLSDLAARGASVLVIEPLSRAAAPWFDDWATTWIAHGGRSDLWKFEDALPPSLSALSEAAGFRRDTLGARTLWR